MGEKNNEKVQFEGTEMLQISGNFPSNKIRKFQGCQGVIQPFSIANSVIFRC